MPVELALAFALGAALMGDCTGLHFEYSRFEGVGLVPLKLSVQADKATLERRRGAAGEAIGRFGKHLEASQCEALLRAIAPQFPAPAGGRPDSAGATLYLRAGGLEVRATTLMSGPESPEWRAANLAVNELVNAVASSPVQALSIRIAEPAGRKPTSLKLVLQASGTEPVTIRHPERALLILGRGNKTVELGRPPAGPVEIPAGSTREIDVPIALPGGSWNAVAEYELRTPEAEPGEIVGRTSSSPVKIRSGWF